MSHDTSPPPSPRPAPPRRRLVPAARSLFSSALAVAAVLSGSAFAAAGSPEAGHHRPLAATSTGETTTTVLRLIAHGPAYVDSNGRTWQPDTAYADGGSTWRSTAAIQGTNDPGLFQGERWGMRGYRLPVPATGTYRVTLNEAELYWDGSTPGQRVFDVTAEGRTVAAGVDIAAAAGVRTAHRVVVETKVSDGVLNVGFVRRTDQPKVASLSVERVYKPRPRQEPAPSPTPTPTPTPAAPQAWLSTPDQSKRVAALPAGDIRQGVDTGAAEIVVDRTARSQRMDGFGAALTESSAHLLMRLSPARREEAMRALFDPVQGAGIDLVRVPLGASDFALSHYSYDDVPAGQSDPDLSRFSIAHDDAEIVPLLQQARAINPSLRVMGTPWSAPGWMKTSGSLIGGSLTPGNEAVYARYLTRVVQEYRARGIPMQFLTLQNEPGFTPGDYPGMRLGAAQARTLVSHLAPQLRAAGLGDVQLIGHDHNWDDTTYPLSLLSDAATRADLAGTAFHCYGGAPEAQLTVRDAYPDEGIWFTECSGGTWSTDFATNLGWNTSTLTVGSVRAHARSVLLWNLALDPSGGPHTGGCDTCRGVLTVDPSRDTVTRNVELDVLALAGKTVEPGAVRVGSTTDLRGIRTVAYENPDGTASMTVYNSWQTSQSVAVRDGSRTMSVTVPAGSVAHLHW